MATPKRRTPAPKPKAPKPELTKTRYERTDVVGPFTPRKGGKIDKKRTTDKFRNA